MLKRTIATVFVTALLCLFALPVTALAVGEPATLYVGNQQVSSGNDITYWTTDKSTGGLTKYEGNDDNWNVKYDPTTVTLTLSGATIQGGTNTGSAPYGAGIYALSSSGQPVALTIELIGTNTITGYYGIFLNAEIDASSYGTNATLTITSENNGSLQVSGFNYGIYVNSGTGGTSLNINDASVVASSSSSYSGYAGVYVQSGASATNSPNISLSVDGGSLTASASEGNDGIQFYVGSSKATGATTSLTVTDNAIVDAKNGGISAKQILSPINTNISAPGSNGGIVFDGKNGTVYGNVTLQEDITIGEGESLTLDDGASLNAGGHNVIVDGGTLDDSIKNSLGDSVTYVVRGVSLDLSALTLTEGGTAQLIAMVEPIDATNKNVTWSSSAHDVATVDASGNVTAVAEGTATITATTEDGGKTATCTVTVEHAHDPAAAWSSDASGHWHACAGCSEKLNFAVHSGKVVGKRDGACTEAGYTGDTVCSVCGYVVAKGVATPATGHSYQDGACTVCGAQEPAKDGDSIPATGDLAPVACALAGIFGMTLVAAGLRNRTSW